MAKDELALDKAIGQYFVVNAHTREFLGAAEGLCCGRYRTRTDDLFRVKQRYGRKSHLHITGQFVKFPVKHWGLFLAQSVVISGRQRYCVFFVSLTSALPSPDHRKEVMCHFRLFPRFLDL